MDSDAPGEHKTLVLDGHSLTISDCAQILRGEIARFAISNAARERVRTARALVEDILERGKPVYGINTGFGRLASEHIPDGDLEALQRNLVRSHAVGVGEPLPQNVVRLAMALRVNSLVCGHSGVREEVPDMLLAMLHAGVTPWVPSQGSVGASGDLAPLSHIAVTLIGEGRAWYEGNLMDAGEALSEAKIAPLTLKPKEGLALINGTQIIQALGLDAITRGQRIAKLADLCAALSFEALQGNPSPYDERVSAIRHHPGQISVAANMRKALAGSARHQQAVKSGMVRVQDPYSLRCVPQVHGAARDALHYVGGVFSREINAVTDNPLLFPSEGDVISGGNFHGEPLAIALDVLAIALSELGAICERRIEQMVNPDLSRLPAFLSPKPGLNSGMMITQVTAAALASENKGHAHPASVDSVPTSANQEDHVSMGVGAAHKARRVTANVERMLEIEALCARFACQFHGPISLGALTQPYLDVLSQRIAPLEEDRLGYPDLAAAREVLADSRVDALLAKLA